MSKIIIDIEDGVDITKSLMKVASIISDGRVSNNGKNYCYGTVFNDNIFVLATRNKKSDTFKVSNYNINRYTE